MPKKPLKVSANCHYQTRRFRSFQEEKCPTYVGKMRGRGQRCHNCIGLNVCAEGGRKVGQEVLQVDSPYLGQNVHKKPPLWLILVKSQMNDAEHEHLKCFVSLGMHPKVNGVRMSHVTSCSKG